MIEESQGYAAQFAWFTSLVAKSEHLAALRRQLQALRAVEVREVKMAQGSKQSRFLAWTFLDHEARAAILRR